MLREDSIESLERFQPVHPGRSLWHPQRNLSEVVGSRIPMRTPPNGNWTTANLENKLLDFRAYFNNHRTHSSREGRRIRPCHDQSSIFARFDGNPTVDPYFRTQWLPGFLKGSGLLRYPVNLGKTSN
jgi:hypothetical protein